MPPVLGPASSSPTRLKSCAGASGDDGLAVADAEDRHLGPVEELLDDEPAVGLGEAGTGVLDGDLARVGDDDALAGGEPVVLDDVRGAEGVERRLDLLHRRAHVGQGGRHVGRGHDLLGEGLAPLETGRLRGGPEDGEPGLTAYVGDACDERRLGADDDEVDPVLARERGDRGPVEDVDGDAEGGDVDARVARRGDDRVDLGIGRDGLDESVFTGAGAEHEDLHGAQPRVRPGEPAGLPGPWATRRRGSSAPRVSRQVPSGPAHVATGDALEDRPQLEDGRPRPGVDDVGLDLHPPEAARLERVREEQELALRVDLRAPPARAVHRPPEVHVLASGVDVAERARADDGARRAEVAVGDEPDRVCRPARPVGAAGRHRGRDERLGVGHRPVGPHHRETLLVAARVGVDGEESGGVGGGRHVEADEASDERRAGWRHTGLCGHEVTVDLMVPAPPEASLRVLGCQ